MQRLYDAGKHGIAKSGVFRSITRSYGVSTSQEAEKAIASYESFIKDCENNDGKNVKRLLGSGRLTPRVAAMARAAHEQLGCSSYYGKSLWLEIEARRDTWCDTDKKRAEFASHLFEFATPEQVLSWWWHANKYDAGYSHHGYGAYRENQGHYEMRWYAEDYDREARRRYPVGSAAFAVAMTTGHVGADMLSWLGDNDGVRAFMLTHASSMFSPEFPWTADWGRGVHSVPWWAVKGLNGVARAALLHDVKDSAYAIGAYRDKWPTSIEDAADADARMGIIRSHAGGRDMKATVEIGVGPYYACRGKEEERYKICKASALSVPAGWMWAELAGYWGRMDGLDARTVFARDFLNTLRADLASDVSDEARFPDGFFTLCVPEARKAVEADMARGALDGKVVLEELDEVLELNL